MITSDRIEPVAASRADLSPQQERVWAASVRRGESLTVRVCFVSPRDDFGRVRAAIDAMAARHPILRQRVSDGPSTAGAPSMTRGAAPAVTLVDLRALAAADGRHAVRAAYDRFRALPLEDARRCALRAIVCATREQGWPIILVAHALVADPETMRRAAHDVSRALLREAPTADPPERIAYGDVVRWMNGLLTSPASADAREYWLRDDPPPFDGAIPFARAGTSRTPSRTRRETLPSTPGDPPDGFAAWVASWFLLLYRTRRQPSLTLGVVVDGRPVPALERVYGPLARVLPVAVTLAPEQTLADVLQQVSERVGEATACQIGFDWNSYRPREEFCPLLVEWIEADTWLAREGVHLLALDGEVDDSHCRCVCTARDGRHAVALHYSPEHLADGHADRLVRALLHIHARLVEQPETTIDGLTWPPALDAGPYADRGRSVVVPDACLAESIASRAVAAPDHVVLVEGHLHLTYEEVWTRASAIARRLAMRGEGPETVVTLFMPRGADAVVAMVGILAAGAAYSAIEPDQPLARLRAIVAATGARTILTVDALREHLADLAPLSLCLDALLGNGRERVDLGTLSRPRPANLAYVAFTSGSTGTPKGIAVEHRSVLNYLAAVEDAFGALESAHVALLSTLQADLGYTMVLGALCRGGTLHVLTRLDVLDAQVVADYFATRYIDVAKTTPSHLAALDEAWPHGAVLSRGWIVGGEDLRQDLVERVRGRTGARVLNEYGPTETTVGVCAYEAGSAAQTSASRSVPIGTPYLNCRVYVLDADLARVPEGSTGELYVGGAQVTRGYLCRPDLTAEGFLPDPFSDVAGSRMYRTGDRGRVTADGTLVFLGRADRQVKVLGHRVELGEIEAVLAQHPAVRDGIVLAAFPRPYSAALTAYVTPQGAAQVDARSLREWMEQRLPRYMVPDVVCLATLPLTPNGKIDQAKLRTLSSAPAPSSSPETTGIAGTIADIWRSLLGREQIGSHDSFFSIGGDSILGIQFVARARQAGILLTPRQLFEHQTIAALVGVARSGAPAVRQADVVLNEYPLAPMQREFFAVHTEALHHFNQAVLLATNSALPASRLAVAIHAVLRQHPALGTSFTRRHGSWLQRRARANVTALTQIDVTALADADRPAAIEQVAGLVQRSLDLDRGPLIRAVVFVVAGAVWRLLIVVHHLVIDVVSWRILVDDLTTVVRQLASGLTPNLPPEGLGFHEWCRRVDALATSERVRAEAAFWAEQVQSVSRLPRDVQTGPNVRSSVAHAFASIAAPGVMAPGPASTEEILLCALTLAIADWVGPAAVTIDVEGHGRDDDVGDLSRTIGWFTTVFPLRIVPESGPHRLRATLREIKERLRSVPAGGVHYSLLRHIARDPAIATGVSSEVIFNYLGQFNTREGKAGLFDVAGEHVGAPASGRHARQHLLEVSITARDGRLHVSFAYSRHVHRADTIERVLSRMVQYVVELAAVCVDEAASLLTPAEFPLARLTAAELHVAVADAPDVEDLYPLSPLQEGILYHTLAAADRDIYVDQLCFSLNVPVQADALAAAWDAVCARHAALRTEFRWHDIPSLVQLVRRDMRPAWHEADWSRVPAERLQDQLEAYLAADRRQGFDISRGPLVRLSLLKTGEDRSCLIWTWHHLLLDGWSVPFVLNDVFELYQASVEARTPRLPVPTPFKAYIEWLQTRDPNDAEAFWRTELAGFTEPARLPALETSTSDADEPSTVELLARLESSETAALLDFGARHALTLNTVLNGMWGAALAIESGTRDVVFGYVTSGRAADVAGVEGIVGPLINTLPMRVRVRPEASCIEWLADLQARQSARIPFEHTPLVSILRWSDLPPNVPLFESILVLENYPVVRGPHPGDAAIEAVAVHNRTNYPISIAVVPGERLTFRVQVDVRQSSVPAVRRAVARMQDLLANVTRFEAATVSELLELTAAERQQLAAWNCTSTDYPRHASIGAMLARQAASRPDAIAVVAGAEQLTYAELDAQANQIARLLRHLGVTTEGYVGLHLGRGVNTLVVMTGVLKAGGAYVPLEVDWPVARLRELVDDCAPSVVVSDASDTSWAAAAGMVMSLADLLARSARMSREAVDEVAGDGTQAANVMYTSGSTGRPKGVVVPHRGIVKLANDRRFARNGADEVFLHLAPLGFDASTLEIWVCLLTGDRLEVAPPGVATLAQIGTWVQERRITTMFLTTALFHVMVAERVGDLRGLRTLMVGGEVVSPALIERARRALPNCTVVNVYGPTECTAICCWYPVVEAFLNRSVPIGGPLDDTTVHVCNSHGWPVPVGVPGELCIGGDGVARGYLNAPAFTAERFVPDVLTAHSGGRLYRTGDRVRYREDGTLEFCGRFDDQVKVRGFRVELAEIESVLREHPDVVDAAVVARVDTADHKRLTGYVVLAAALSDGGDLRAYVATRLPDYMVPDAIIALPALPMTPTGKLARARLPVLEPTSAATTARADAPRDRVELVLATIWRDVLRRARIGIYDDFFAAGGHSIAAIHVIDRIERDLGITIPIAALLEASTIHALAERVRMAGSARRLLTPLQRKGSRPPIFCVHAGGGTVLCYESLARVLGADQPLWSFQAPGVDEGTTPVSDVAQLAQLYVEDLLIDFPAGPYYLAGWSFGGVVALEMARRLAALGHHVPVLALIDCGAQPDAADPTEIDDALAVSMAFPDLSLDQLRGMSPDDQLRHALASAGLDASLPTARRLRDVFKAHLGAHVSYRPSTYAGDVLVLYAEEGLHKDLKDPTLGWSAWVRGDVSAVAVPGTHWNVMSEPAVTVVGASLVSAVDAVHRSLVATPLRSS